MLRIRILLCALLTSSTVAFGASQALASHSQALYFEGSSDLLNPQTREHAISQLQLLGVNSVRVELYWAQVAPDSQSATKPNFDATNPASYNWGGYDWLLAKANELHWKVLLTVTSPVPSWATSNHKAPYVTRPSSVYFREFMTAVARHYGAEVSLYAVWNEPNHPAFLLPQFNSNGTPASPLIYRSLFQAGYEGLKAGGISSPKLLMGETAPTGSDRNKGLHDVAPLEFLRDALCLNAKYKKSSSCSSLPAYGYSHHAYTKPNLAYVPPNKDDVTIATLSRLSSALTKAAKAHMIKAGMPIYLTEFGIQSYPNKELGVPVAQQAEYYAIAEKIAYENPRVAAFSQYLLSDDPLGGKPGSSANGGFIGFQTGLEYVNEKPKPLYAAFPVPLVVVKQHSGFSLWGLVRPAHKTAKVTVLIKRKGSHGYSTLKTLTTNGAGYWTLKSSAQGTSWRVRWVSSTGVKDEGPPIRAYKAI
jgi:hypothetical protein